MVETENFELAEKLFDKNCLISLGFETDKLSKVFEGAIVHLFEGF